MDWTYNVKISTEAGAGITNAVQELSTTQQKASEKFNDIVEFLNGEAFAEIILNTLLEHLEKQNKEEDDKKIEDHFTSIIESIQQVQAGIITLMDLKEGNFSNVLDSFRLASESLDEKGIEDAIIKMFRKDVGDFSISDIVEKASNIFSQLPRSIGDVDESDKYADINLENILTDKFLQKPTSTFDNILKEFQTELPVKIYTEFQKFFRTLGEDGKEVFKNVLEWEGDRMKDAKGNTALYFIKKQMTDFLKTKRNLEQAVKIGRAPQSALDEYRKDPKSRFDFGKQGHWDDLKDAFKRGFSKNLLKDKDSFLKDKSVFSIAGALIDDFFDITQEKLVRSVNMPRRRNIPSLENVYESVSTDLQSFDFENLQNSLNQFMGEKDDPFNLELFKKEFNDIFKQSQLEANTTKYPSANLEGILKENLKEAGFEDIFSIPISKLITELTSKDFEGAFKVREQIEELFKGLSDTEEISVTERLNKSLKEVFDEIEKTMSEFRESKDGKKLPNITEIDFDRFFAKSLLNQELIGDTIMFAKQTIVNTINDRTNQLDSNINKAISMLSGLGKSLPGEATAATPKDLKSYLTRSYADV